MRHGRKVNHLGRTTSHRKAMLANMAISLIEHKRITTTVAKAKALRVYVEPIITRCKVNTTHNRRVIFSTLQNKEALKELFGVVSGKVADRPGGYCRIIKLGFRRGDNAEIAMIELVDFNETMLGAEQKKRSRRSKKKSSSSVAAAPVAAAPVVEEAPAVEETVAQVEAPEVQPEAQNEEEQA